MEIKFLQGSGFAGDTYTLKVDDRYYHLCTNLGGAAGDDQAKKIELNKLTELGIDFKEEIKFKWDGSL